MLGLCTRSVLRAHGLNEFDVYTVFQSTVLSRLQYASQAWWGFANSSDRDRLEAFQRRSIRAGFMPRDSPTFASLCDVADKTMFDAIKSCSTHVLRPLLQTKLDCGYNLRQRCHDFVLPDNSNRLLDCNYLNRTLFNKSY